MSSPVFFSHDPQSSPSLNRPHGYETENREDRGIGYHPDAPTRKDLEDVVVPTAMQCCVLPEKTVKETDMTALWVSQHGKEMASVEQKSQSQSDKEQFMDSVQTIQTSGEFSLQDSHEQWNRNISGSDSSASFHTAPMQNSQKENVSPSVEVSVKKLQERLRKEEIVKKMECDAEKARVAKAKLKADKAKMERAKMEVEKARMLKTKVEATKMQPESSPKASVTKEKNREVQRRMNSVVDDMFLLIKKFRDITPTKHTSPKRNITKQDVSDKDNQEEHHYVTWNQLRDKSEKNRQQSPQRYRQQREREPLSNSQAQNTVEVEIHPQLSPLRRHEKIEHNKTPTVTHQASMQPPTSPLLSPNSHSSDAHSTKTFISQQSNATKLKKHRYDDRENYRSQSRNQGKPIPPSSRYALLEQYSPCNKQHTQTSSSASTSSESTLVYHPTTPSKSQPRASPRYARTGSDGRLIPKDLTYTLSGDSSVDSSRLKNSSPRRLHMPSQDKCTHSETLHTALHGKQPHSPTPNRKQSGSPVPCKKQLNSPSSCKKQQNSPKPCKKQVNGSTPCKKQLGSPTPCKKQLNNPSQIRNQISSPIPRRKQPDSPIICKKQINSPNSIKKPTIDAKPCESHSDTSKFGQKQLNNLSTFKKHLQNQSPPPCKHEKDNIDVKIGTEYAASYHTSHKLSESHCYRQTKNAREAHPELSPHCQKSPSYHHQHEEDTATEDSLPRGQSPKPYSFPHPSQQQQPLKGILKHPTPPEQQHVSCTSSDFARDLSFGTHTSLDISEFSRELSRLGSEENSDESWVLKQLDHMEKELEKEMKHNMKGRENKKQGYCKSGETTSDKKEASNKMGTEFVGKRQTNGANPNKEYIKTNAKQIEPSDKKPEEKVGGSLNDILRRLASGEDVERVDGPVEAESAEAAIRRRLNALTDEELYRRLSTICEERSCDLTESLHRSRGSSKGRNQSGREEVSKEWRDHQGGGEGEFHEKQRLRHSQRCRGATAYSFNEEEDIQTEKEEKSRKFETMQEQKASNNDSSVSLDDCFYSEDESLENPECDKAKVNRNTQRNTPIVIHDAVKRNDSANPHVQNPVAEQSFTSIKSAASSVKSHASSVKSQASSVKSYASSVRSKGSSCSCKSASSVQTVYRDPEEGISLLEIHYPPDAGLHDPNCSILSINEENRETDRDSPIANLFPSNPPQTEEESEVECQNISIQVSVCIDTSSTMTDGTVDASPNTIPVSITSLSTAELRQELIKLGETPGPILANTRHVYEQRLFKLKQDPSIQNQQKQDKGKNMFSIFCIIIFFILIL